MYGGFFIEHTADGKPFLGYQYVDGAVNMRLFLCNKDTAVATSATFDRAMTELMKTDDKLIVAEGSIDGLRKPQGRQQHKPGGKG